MGVFALAWQTVAESDVPQIAEEARSAGMQLNVPLHQAWRDSNPQPPPCDRGAHPLSYRAMVALVTLHESPTTSEENAL